MRVADLSGAGNLDLAAVEAAERAGHALIEPVLERARALTEQGKTIDDRQVLTERVAYAATEVRAAQETLAFVKALRAEGRSHEMLELTAGAAIAELVVAARNRVEPIADELGLGDSAFEAAFPARVRTALRALASEARMRRIGVHAIEVGGRTEPPLDETLEQVRASVREFAAQEVVPHAERIHRRDEDIPDEFISKMGELGYFGLSIPEQYGGHELGNLAMILTTEELSRASLAAAGSLITRPEILTKALLQGGTEAQKKQWLPKLASGAVLVGVSVTEPDIGSDVAGVKCRATRGSAGGRDGWLINGPKAWCTFAGRADVLSLLARTDPDPAKAARGLSLFMLPKDRFRGHAFEMLQPGGGKLTGKADATPGYRGMHSFTLGIENYFVPAENLVGGEQGLGKGFYLQMGGFGAGRLQTGGRACGLAQAALEETAKYVAGRNQFGHPIADVSAHAVHARSHGGEAARRARRSPTPPRPRWTPTSARPRPIAAQAKLLACDIAVEVTQQGQLMHGGWGYAEEYPISRYVVDAQVLPIFEGVKPILELKVIGRALLSGEA